MPRKKASTARKSKPAGKRAKTKAPARAALKSKSARAPATKNSEASIPEPKQADTTMPAPSDSRAEDLARTATELMKRAPALLSVGSEKLSVFTALDGWDFVTFRAEEKKLHCFHHDSTTLICARPIVRWEPPSFRISSTSLFFGPRSELLDSFGSPNESALNALRGEPWDDGAIIPPSELGPEAKSPYLCLTSGQGYATFAVGRDSTGRAAGLLIWTEGRFKELPELIETLHLDPKDSRPVRRPA